MTLTLEPEGDHDPIRAEEHDPEETQDVALGDPEDAEESSGSNEEAEDDEAE